jgi:hypothetical protein
VVQASGWRPDPDQAQRMMLADVKVFTTVRESGAATLLVYKDQFQSHGKLDRAKREGSGMQYTTMKTFLAAMDGAGMGAARDGSTVTSAKRSSSTMEGPSTKRPRAGTLHAFWH